jgi:hypothetical protein
VNGDFYGLATHSLANDHLRLEFLAQAGPRLVRLSLTGSDENLLAETPDSKVNTPFGDYHLRGGHRLWHAPEALGRTYVPDDSGLSVEMLPDGVRLVQPTETVTGIRKSIEIHMRPDRPALNLHHRLHNDGVWPVELAPWAITQLPLGGVAILPQPEGPAGTSELLPNRRLALWPYSRWSDPRLHIHDSCIVIHAQAQLPPFKIGYLNTHGWLGYLRNGVFFCKRFTPDPKPAYPDFGCNAEVYCNDQFVELETLGPLRVLAPGEAVSHVEAWELYRGLEMPDLPDAIRQGMEALHS